MLGSYKTTLLNLTFLFLISFNISAQDCNKVKELYELKKYPKVIFHFDSKINYMINEVSDDVINSPCFEYYLLSLEKKSKFDKLCAISKALAVKSESKSFKRVLSDSALLAITSLYSSYNLSYYINSIDLSSVTSWILKQENLNKQSLINIFNYFKLNRYELTNFAQYSGFMTYSARLYIWKYGINDFISLEMFDILNSIYKQSPTGSFFPVEVKSQIELKKSIEKGEIAFDNFSRMKLKSGFNFAGVPMYSNYLSYENSYMQYWYRNVITIEKTNIEKLDMFFHYFTNNHYYYKAAIALNTKLNNSTLLKEDFKLFYNTLSKIPSDMFPEVNKVFLSTLNEYYELNKNSSSFQKFYLQYLLTTNQNSTGINQIEQLRSDFKNTINLDSFLMQFKIQKIFNQSELEMNPSIVFSMAIDQKLPFSLINQYLELTISNRNSKQSSSIFFCLYNKYPEYKDSIWWGFCDYLFPGSNFSETELNNFILIYKNLKKYDISSLAEYDLWNGKTHTEILNAIKANKISKSAGWQLIAEYGIYYYSESDTRNSTETKKSALKLMMSAANFLTKDGELQKHIGHCLFLLGRSSEAQAYYRRAQSLGANMTDVGVYGGTGTRTGPRGGKHNFKFNPGTVNSK